MRFLLVVLAALGIGLTGCPEGAPGPDDDDNGGDDDVSDDDDDGADGLTDGSVSLVYVDSVGVALGVNFSATFHEIVTPPEMGYDLDPPTQEDDCGLFTFTLDELMNADPGELVYESAGTITLTGPGGLSVDLEPEDIDGTLTYQLQVPEAQFTFGEDYGMDVAGDEFPGFSTTLEMTEKLVLLEPATQTGMFDWTDGALDVAWTGTDGAEALISLTSMDEQENGAMVMCMLANDGSFSVPANVMSQLPGPTVALLIQHYNSETMNVGGRSVMVMAGAGASVAGMRN